MNKQFINNKAIKKEENFQPLNSQNKYKLK